MATGLVLASAAKGVGQIVGGIENAQAAYDNAGLMIEQADYAMHQAEFQADVYGRQGERALGAQRANVAMSGVKTAGSPLLVMRENEKTIRSDVKNILESGRNARDLGYSQAESLRKQGGMALFGSIVQGGTTFLTDTASIGVDYGWWGPYKKNGQTGGRK